ncbi:hypothetical protein CSW98_05275 [Vibrio sp. HA2012]|uniref:hypothetical protein n=1 Tax=Vibrio sp. HA2012 TaxID=1971595 RepID=UPI000C2BA79C|nr:hypothetical protein [Vibrio sp. HA2012]PJC87314.1 hypothetical protein CSW98_05275 [Vibrio sp. HA2012]
MPVKITSILICFSFLCGYAYSGETKKESPCQVYFPDELAAKQLTIDTLPKDKIGKVEWDGQCTEGKAIGKGKLYIDLLDKGPYIEISGNTEHGKFVKKVDIGTYKQPRTSDIRTGSSGSYWVYEDSIFDSEADYDKHLLILESENEFSKLNLKDSDIDTLFSFIKTYESTPKSVMIIEYLLEDSENLELMNKIADVDFIPKNYRATASEIVKKTLNEKYKLSILTNIKEEKSGSRYIPTVSNTYYTTVDESYYVDGQYVSKYKTQENNVVSDGYDESIYTKNLIFAIDNQSDKAYSILFQANWTSTEYYYEEESYCSRMGWIFCKQWSKRNVRKEKYIPKRYRQYFIMSPQGRVKNRITLGEKEPDDLVYTITEFNIVPSDIFEEYSRVMEGVSEENLAKIHQLKDEKILIPYLKNLEDRASVIRRKLDEIFSDKHIADSSFAVVLPQKYDPEFTNKVTINVIAKNMPLNITLKTPVGEKQADAYKKISGIKISDYCFFCEYQGEIVLEGIKGISGKQWNTDVSVGFVRPVNSTH